MAQGGKICFIVSCVIVWYRAFCAVPHVLRTAFRRICTKHNHALQHLEIKAVTFTICRGLVVEVYAS